MVCWSSILRCMEYRIDIKEQRDPRIQFPRRVLTMPAPVPFGFGLSKNYNTCLGSQSSSLVYVSFSNSHRHTLEDSNTTYVHSFCQQSSRQHIARSDSVRYQFVFACVERCHISNQWQELVETGSIYDISRDTERESYGIWSLAKALAPVHGTEYALPRPVKASHPV